MSVYTRWYKDGTIAVTKGSAAVVGTSTYWKTAGLNPGDIVKIAGVDYELASVTDNTHLTLATNYAGNTASGLTYSIVRNFTATSGANVAAQAAKLLGDVERYIDTDMQKINGKSAYEVAVSDGYTGTKAQWLESLKAAGEWSSAKSRLTDLESRATAIEGVNSSQAESISTISARTLGIVNGSPRGSWGNAPMHNSIFRGKALGKFTQAHSDAIKNGSFSDIYLGDFFTDSTGYWGGYVVIGFDWFSTSPISPHHLVLKCHDTSVPIAKFNDTATTAGGYVDSKWRNETKPALEAQIAADFIDDSHLWKHSESFVSAVDANGNATGYVEKSNACVEMFDEMQICGMRAYHTCEKNAAGVASAYNRQFPYFRFIPWGWSNGHTLTRTILNSTQIRMLYNFYTGRAESAANEYQTFYYFTVN